MISSWLFGAGCAVFAFLILRKLSAGNSYSLLGSLTFFFSGMISNYSGFDYGGHIYLFFLLAATYILIKNEFRLSDKQRLTVGLLIGLAAAFRIDLSGAYFLGLVATLIYQKRKNKARRKYFWRDLLMIAAGCTLVFLLVYLPLLKYVPLYTLISEILIKPPIHATAESVQFLATTIALGRQLFSQVGNAGVITLTLLAFRFLYDFIYQILPLVTLLLFWWFVKKSRPEKKIKISVILIMFWSLFTLPKALSIIDVHYLSVLNTPLILAFLIMAWQFFTSVRKSGIYKIFRIIIALIIVLLLIAVPASRAVESAHYYSDGVFRIAGEQDSIFVSDAVFAGEMNSIISIIQNETAKGGYIFVAPFYAPPFYELTGRTDATYYDSVIDLAFVPSAEKQENICESLGSSGTNLVVYGKDCQFYWGGACFKKGFEILDNCIKGNYTKTAEIGQYSIYLRK
jgi:hypothetical protein